MRTATHLLQRALWYLRLALRHQPRSRPEGLWRVRHLRHHATGKGGQLLWEGCRIAYADGDALFQQLNEIFIHGTYDFCCANKNPRIIDCGAHVGCAVRRWRQTFPGARITAIEADSAIAALLRDNLRHWDDDETEVLTAAVWTHDGEVRFAPTGRDNGMVTASGTRVVPALDLARLCRSRIDLLKLDIEGAEAAILQHLAASGALQNIRALICEWHEWDPAAPRLHEGLSQLAGAGFQYRIAQAGTLGDNDNTVFPQLRSPGNQMMIYAWQQ